MVLWVRRRRWTRRRLPEWALRTESSFALGAAVTALDLLTAFPYFGAIGVIVSSDLALPGQVVVLVVFNALYVLPLVAVRVADSLFGERAEAVLARGREAIERLSPAVLTLLTLAAGIALVVRGANGLADS
jgi:cytochrome c biogenesis protein CcdA